MKKELHIPIDVYDFLKIILKPKELNIHSTKEEFVENLVKERILKNIEFVMDRGFFNE